MSRWFRHYAGMMRDDKLVGAAIRAKQTVERVVWVWGAILESAGEINDGGKFEIDPAEVAYFLRADEADISSILSALAHAGRVAEGVVVNWGARQFQSDTSATRQAAYRERKRANDDQRDVQKTSGDVTVTAASRHGDAPETETEANTEKKLSRSKPTECEPSRFEEFWKAYPRRDGPNPRKDAEKKFAVMVKTGVDPQTMIDAAKQLAVDEARRGNIGTRFIPQAVTWLNGQRWIDHATEIVDQKLADDGNVEVMDEEALAAWDRYRMLKEGKTFPRNKRGGWRHPTQWPPGHNPAERTFDAPPIAMQSMT